MSEEVLAEVPVLRTRPCLTCGSSRIPGVQTEHTHYPPIHGWPTRRIGQPVVLEMSYPPHVPATLWLCNGCHREDHEPVNPWFKKKVIA